MPELLTPSQDLSQLGQWVRASLTHLYDTAFLQIHPLGALIAGEQGFDNVTRAQRLRRTLLDCIEMLRPRQGQTTSSAARAYVILTYRYMDGLSIEDVMDKLSLSRRQVYREHEKGIEAITSLLADKLSRVEPRTEVTTIDTNDSRGIAEAEVNRLRQFATTDALSVSDLLNSVVQLLEPLARDAQCQIAVTAQTGLPLVKADRVHVRQACVNILTQAIGLAHPVIDLRLMSDDNGVWIHIDMPSVDHISCDDAPDEQHCIELAIARSLIEAQGGDMHVASQDGWHVTLRLPIAEEKSSILVIDDNADLVELFRRYLGGHHVTLLTLLGVSESNRALQLSAEMQPQLITLDVMMPNFDGWDVLQQLKSRPETRHIPVVVCSVLNEARLALSMGASGYLTKPVNQVDFWPWSGASSAQR